jgi:HEPN domain-containing protein
LNDPRRAALGLLEQLAVELARGEREFAAGRFGPACRAAYDVIEGAGKAARVAVGVEPPKWADVGPQLDEHRGRFAARVRGHVDTLIHSVRVAWEEREAGFESGVGQARAEHLYDDYDARGALDTASRVLRQVREWIDAA